MRELETQAVEAEERRLAKEREDAERQREWEAAIDHAKRRLVEDHRINVLRDRVRTWHEADAIRAYCDPLEARHGDSPIAAGMPDAAEARARGIGKGLEQGLEIGVRKKVLEWMGVEEDPKDD